MKTQLRILLCAALALTGYVSAYAQATGYPNKTIKIVSPYAPGGSTDLLTRAAAELVGKKLGQAMIIESRPGAGTLIATRGVKAAEADGYTLLLQSNGFVSNLHAFKEPGYAMADFKPVAVLGKSSYVLMISTKGPARDIKEFVEYAKGRNDLSYGTLGRGGRTHILAEEFATRAGFKWQDIPYKGGADGVNAVLGRHIDGYFASVALAHPHAQSSNLRLIGIASEVRSEFLPAVPTFKEAGIPQMTDDLWIALFARSDIPQPILDTLRTAFREVSASEEMKVVRQRIQMSTYTASLAEFETSMNAALVQTIQEFKQHKLPQQ
ncbi:Bug family tripartite tricarboxylate transporter substrate binding protein [Ottowia thiooxydans]|uniref:Bug family tripartite tricarboxylate transporter substrate binding protein n=1 Tax=Ottowia thiooxydans TaxID=219182 RepID=UPI00040A637B|nr:tripartite tricarboxylate transporter substrate binding protein [Ottowia thiooxydans]